MMTEVDHLLAEVLDGDANVATVEKLAALVRTDTVVRQRFLAQVAIAGALRTRHLPAARLETVRKNILATLSQDQELPGRQVVDRPLTRTVRRVSRWWILTGIAVVTVGAMLFSLEFLPATTGRVAPAVALGRTFTPAAATWNGTGTGLRGDYFADHTFTRLAGSRVDPQIRFEWPGSPIETMPADQFTVRWTGNIQPGISGAHTLIVRADDGVRLWIDGKLLIDTWEQPNVADQRSEIVLDANRLYRLQLDYIDHSGVSEIALWWQVAGFAPEVIPSSQLHVSP